MEVQQKRKLLEAVDILVRRPAATTETTLAEALAYFKLLVEEATQGQIEVVYNDTTSELPF
ncbi:MULTISPECIES: hypothetical protein [unclassified Acinetobacter]|uniref:hypothetical protein n=1 Tax=unclassified Acinetobacter TaxID=196816 RepID=UPI001F4B6873|nr:MULTISPECIES: hypothetical protein [unclassified Acinetobacter]MCH7353312.1 hypothetical protein [Acinetobacter sp. NIPH 2023]MCH7360694.1 hypothetical protein [Acinetobacter sp. NIPH 2024]